MKCPLRILVVREAYEVGIGYVPDCLKEGCAWWDKIRDVCAVTYLINIAEILQFFLKEIRDKVGKK